MVSWKCVVLFVCARICSADKADMTGKIVGGSHTKIAAYPHSMFISMSCSGQWICGSSIVNTKIFLTAAHCLEGCRNIRYWSIEAFAGHEDLGKAGVFRKVARFIVHHDYDDMSLINDIALGALAKDLPLGDNIKRVLIRPQFPGSNHDPYVAGWGIVNDRTGEETMILKALSQKLRPRPLCRKIGYLHPGMMCAGSPDTRDDRPSRGDSGSALVLNGVCQIGLVSFMVDDYRSMPIYTNVSYYYEWIRQKTYVLLCGRG